MGIKMNVLIVEDDQPLRKIIATILEEEQYKVEQAEDGEEGYLLAVSTEYDLYIIDIMLPKMDGFSLINQLRMEGNRTPTLILTAKDQVEDKVRGLDLGADDYLVKPFATQEFLARVRSLLRRAGKLGMGNQLSYGPLHINLKQHECQINQETLKLTNKEYELLFYLVQNKEQIITREQVYERVWGIESDTTDAIVDLYIHYLRKKLQPYRYNDLIHTVRGVGYMLKKE